MAFVAGATILLALLAHSSICELRVAWWMEQLVKCYAPDKVILYSWVWRAGILMPTSLWGCPLRAATWPRSAKCAVIARCDPPGSAASAAHQAVILGVTADPEPMDTGLGRQAQRSVMETNSHAVKFTTR
jgi:hypothetical protein